MIIGLSGYAKSGKYTVASHLVRLYGFERRAFADKMKATLLALDPSLDGDIALAEFVHQMNGWDKAKQDPAVRELLQRFGMSAREHIGPDVWVNALFADEVPERLVISDVRLPNEAQAIVDRGGVIVRITRPGFGPVNGHKSETALDDWPFDRRLLNSGSMFVLMDLVQKLAASLFVSALVREDSL